MDWTNVASINEWPESNYKIIEIDEVSIAVFRIDGKFYAFEDNCPHEHICFVEDSEQQGDKITCPHHGAEFNISTGEVLAPPAYDDLTTFPVQITEGIVQVRDPRWD